MGAHADAGRLGGEAFRGAPVSLLSSKGRAIEKLKPRALWRGWPGRILRLTFGVLPVVWMTRRLALRDVLDALGRGGLGPLGLAWALLFTGLVVGAYRWRILTSAYGGRDIPRVPTLVRYLLVGAYFNMLPGGIAGEGLRAVRMRPHVDDLMTSLNVLVVERIVGLVGLLALAAAATAWLPSSEHAVLARCLEAGAISALVLAIGAIILPYWAARSPDLRSATMKVPLVGALLLKVPPAQRPKLMVTAVVLSLLTQGFAIASILTVTRAIVPEAPRAIVAVVPLIILVTHVPIAPGGIGQREAAFVYFFALLGIDAAQALATSVTVLMITLSFGALGAVCYLAETLLRGRRQAETITK